MADPAPTASRCLLRDAAVRWPTAPALRDGDRLFTFAELESCVAATAAAWRDAGGGAGMHMAVLLGSGSSSVIAVLAALRLGMVACLLSARNPPALLRAQLVEADCTRFVTDGTALDGAETHAVVRLPLPTRDAIPAAVPSAPHGAATPDAPATLIYTSGSAGKPKAALHSYRNHRAAAQAAVAVNDLRPGDRWLLSLPIWHVGGLSVLFRCLCAGATVVIPAVGEALAASLERYAVTHVSLVPTQLKRLLSMTTAPAGVDRLRVILLGGAPIPRAVLGEAVARGWPVCATYGLTEMTSQVATVAADASGAMRLQAPHPLPGVELRVTAAGEILVRGEMLFMGYWEQGTVRRPLTSDGWFATGDLGYLQEGGGLALSGRRDNLFISGGENIQPEEIEGALAALPGVEVAVVVAVPDDAFGHRPGAYVRMRTGPPDGAALRARLAEQLPAFKIPIWFREWPAHIDAQAPKIARRALREYAAGTATATAGRQSGGQS